MTATTPTRKLTYADYVKIPNDGRRHEIIDGVHYINGQRHDLVGEESLMNPAPSTYHQIVSGRIFFQLFQQIQLQDQGFVFPAPCDVQLSENKIVQPDIVVVLNDRKWIITPTKIKGSPNLVVEILSPSSDENDCVTKRELYQTAGVPEYWIINPLEHTVEQLVLRGGRYQPEPEVNIRHLTILDSVSVRVNEIW
jgi:Uma2 family endonuclease